MPEPQSGTVRVKMPDGHIWNIPRQNLARAKMRGATEVAEKPPEESALDRFAQSWRTGMGLSPKGGVKEDLAQIGSGLKQEFTHPIESAKLLAEGFVSSQEDVAKKAHKELLHGKDWKERFHGMIREIYAGLPGLGPMLNQAGEQFEKGDVAGGMGTMTPILAGESGKSPIVQRLGLKAADLPGKAVRTGVRAALEVAPEDVKKAREKVEAPVREQKAKFETAKQEARVRNKSVHEASEAEATRAKAREVAEGQKARVENSKLEGQRQSYEGLQERLSKQTSENLDRAEKMEKMALDADYEDFRKKVLGVSKGNPNGTLQANLSPVGEAVLKAKDTIIKGSQTNVPIFKDLMGRFSEMIDEAEGLKPAENQMLTADQLRGYVKELNDKIYASEVPSDVRNAMIHVRDVADKQISDAIKDVHGKAASNAYDALKDRYADYKETWFDKHSGSPVPKIRELLRAPVARNRGIPVYREVGDVLLGKDGEKIMAVLGRKRPFGADTKLIAQLRSTAEKLKALPKPKEVPAVTPREAPNVAKLEAPKPPDFEKFDPEQFVKDTLEGKAKTLQRWGTIGAVSWALRDVLHGRLPSKALLATPGAQFLLKKAMTSPRFQKWLMEGGIEK